MTFDDLDLAAGGKVASFRSAWRRTGQVLEQIAAQQMTTPGAQLYVAVNGAPVLDIAVGRTWNDAPMARSTLHAAFCVTKPIVAVTLVEALARHSVPLDIDIRDLVAVPPGLADQPVRILDILNHQAGLSKPSMADYVTTPDEVRPALLQQATWTERGYSEVVGWWLLTRALDVLDGDASAALRQFTARLGIDNDVYLTAPSGPATRALQPRVGVYFVPGDPPRPLASLRLRARFQRLAPWAEGLVAARGLGRFADYVLAQLRTPSEASGPASPVAAAVALRGERRVDPVLRTEVAFAGGFMCNKQLDGFGGRTSAGAVGHIGGLGPSWFFTDPELGLTVAWVGNGLLGNEEGDNLRQLVVGAACDDLAL